MFEETFHTLSTEQALKELQSQPTGLDVDAVAARRAQYGTNIFPVKRGLTLPQIFLHQFLNPLIYILLVAAVASVLLDDYADAFFILVVLLLNAIIGTLQEHNAEKSAKALREMAATLSLVERNGEILEINAIDIVPGDIVLLETGRKVPADLRLLTSHTLEIDESLLTGESLPVLKNHDLTLKQEVALGDKKNMAFKGTLVVKGRGKGIVVGTGLRTQLGKIAHSITEGVSAKPPLLIRMERFTKKIAYFLLFVCAIMGAILLYKGQSWHEVLMITVALAVAAIPEGLPVALTVALSIASRKMSKRNVIVRKLPAVESLGSCTYIATDKTGTLTVNQMTIQKIALPLISTINFTGSGLNPEGRVEYSSDQGVDHQKRGVEDLLLAGTLCNEAQLHKKEDEWMGSGDAVDLAFLVSSYKIGQSPYELRELYELVQEIPFEPENQYAATLHRRKSDGDLLISIKGAIEKILAMCSQMQTASGLVPLDRNHIQSQAEELAKNGYRVLALAKKSINSNKSLHAELESLVFLGLVGMIDPLRPEAAQAIQYCRGAGIDVAMVTGDHPTTSLAIAKELGLAMDLSQVVSGPQLKSARTQEEKIRLVSSARVFARVEPQQKLEIVQILLGQGKFVAVTGDGANDAPALKAANVGVAMGKSGTDVAKETADLIITDDRFASIIAGIEEGRIAYNNVRKVVYLLISTGAAEILMFTLSIIYNTPLPLTAVQLLWLNLVTNGIQDVGLAFEPGEGDELKKSPRKPNEAVFNRIMIERVALSALVMGSVAFVYFKNLIDSGASVFVAQNMTLLLMVLFENVMVGNCRSETKSAFVLNPLRNKVLFFGTIGAQLLHIGAMYTPGLSSVLGLQPVSFVDWLQLLGLSLTVLFAVEIYKLVRRPVRH